jgi:hypothetical protein
MRPATLLRLRKIKLYLISIVYFKGIFRFKIPIDHGFRMAMSRRFTIVVTFLVFGAGKSPLTPLCKGGN